MKRKKLDITSLDGRLKILQWEKHNHLLTQLAKIESNTYNHFKKWTPLKLCGLSYFAGGYARILENLKNKQFSGNLKIIYIDLFSGCGINQINHVLIAGSPLVCIDSVTNSNVKFDKMFFNDAKSEYSTALARRLEFLSEKDTFAWIKNKYIIFNKDCNEAIKDIEQYMNSIKYKNYLAFIDPYHMEIWWKSMEKLLSFEYGDIMIVLQAKLIARTIGTYLHSRSLSHGKKIQKFLGEENHSIIEKLRTEESVKKYYINKIYKYRKFIVDIEIKSGKRDPYRYYLIFATRKENPHWKNYIMKMKKFVETFSGDLVETSIDYITGKAQRLYY